MKTKQLLSDSIQSTDVEMIRSMYPRLVEAGVMENRALVAELMMQKALAEWESNLE